MGLIQFWHASLTFLPSFSCNNRGNPIVAKAGGLQSQGDKGEAVVILLRALVNAGSGVLRLFGDSPPVAKAGGLQSQGDKGEAIVILLRALVNAGSGVLRLFGDSPPVAKAGGLQSQGDKGEAVVILLRALVNAGSGVLRLLQLILHAVVGCLLGNDDIMDMALSQTGGGNFNETALVAKLCNVATPDVAHTGLQPAD